jgi:hypothetical protein
MRPHRVTPSAPVTPSTSLGVTGLTHRGNSEVVEASTSYLIWDDALPALRTHVIEQADASETDVAERLLGQLASLDVHCQQRASRGPLTFRPTAATAQLAARAIAALRATPMPSSAEAEIVPTADFE